MIFRIRVVCYVVKRDCSSLYMSLLGLMEKIFLLLQLIIQVLKNSLMLLE